jgi:hypothetical protein
MHVAIFGAAEATFSKTLQNPKGKAKWCKMWLLLLRQFPWMGFHEEKTFLIIVVRLKIRCLANYEKIFFSSNKTYWFQLYQLLSFFFVSFFPPKRAQLSLQFFQIQKQNSSESMEICMLPFLEWRKPHFQKPFKNPKEQQSDGKCGFCCSDNFLERFFMKRKLCSWTSSNRTYDVFRITKRFFSAVKVFSFFA